MKINKDEIQATLLQYLLSILVIAVTTGLLWAFQRQLSTQVIALIYLLPVVLCARLWGLGPGILAATCSFLSLNYFFLPPLYTFIVHRSQDLLVLIVFLVIAVVISQLLGHDQESLAVATAREREATQLYELSVALAGLLNQESIAQILADKICETFRAEKVEVTLQGKLKGSSFTCLGKDSSTTPPRKPDLAQPLMTARGQLGTIGLWRKGKSFTRSEEQLFSTFSSQGALAIERALLMDAETHTKVLEESDRLKSSLLSSVSHELRTPLSTIKASISSLRSGEIDWDSEARMELVTAIEEETDHLNQLVGNLLDMTRIETGALHPQRKWNSLAEITGSVLKRMQTAVQNHSLLVEIPADLPLLPVDYVQMEQVLTNLISNSVKYAPAGTTITIRASTQPDQTVLVQVANQGPHVDEENLERIFDKFYRVTAADKVTGTGLGLSICKGIVEAHGGRIWAENAPDHFIFNFTLPQTWEGTTPQTPKEV